MRNVPKAGRLLKVLGTSRGINGSEGECCEGQASGSLVDIGGGGTVGAWSVQQAAPRLNSDPGLKEGKGKLS